MNLRIEAMAEVTYVMPEGRLDFDAAPGFQEALERVLSAAGKAPAALIIDGAALEYVSSAGLRAVLLAARAAQRARIAFALCSLQPAVREVFDLSGFSRIIAVHADRATALAQARRARAARARDRQGRRPRAASAHDGHRQGDLAADAAASVTTARRAGDCAQRGGAPNMRFPLRRGDWRITCSCNSWMRSMEF